MKRRKTDRLLHYGEMLKSIHKSSRQNPRQSHALILLRTSKHTSIPFHPNLIIPAEIVNPPHCINSLHECVPDINNQPPLFDEIQAAINDLKKRKSIIGR